MIGVFSEFASEGSCAQIPELPELHQHGAAVGRYRIRTTREARIAFQNDCDVIVIGAGSAAFEAAIAAGEAGAERVVMLEKAPEKEFGGNARFPNRVSLRAAGADEIREFVPQIDEPLIAAW